MYRDQYLIKNENKGQYRRIDSEERYYESKKINEQFEQFCTNVKNFLVSESINYILQTTLQEKSSTDREMGKVLCENFVKEIGASSLLKRFEHESYTLAEISSVINETYDNVMCKIDKNDTLTFCIKPSDKKSFYDGLDGLDVSKISDKIHQRCCDATADFIQSNINDKLDFEEIANKTKEKIDNIKARSKEQKDNMMKEYAMITKQQTENVRNRKKNIYEQMVINMTSQIIKNSNLSEKFTNEEGKLNIDKITETVDVMYHFLETINTAKIYNVNESYLKSILESIQ